MHRNLALGAVLFPIFFNVACGGATVGEGGNGSDGGAGVDSEGPPVVPPGPPPNGEVPVNHHPAPSACSHDRGAVRPSADAGAPDPFGDASTGECQIDSDCSAGQNGRCSPLGGWGARVCTYDECFVDTDCGTNGVCECAQSFGGERQQPNVCSRNGNCSIDSDCGANGYCSPSVKESSQCSMGPAPAGYYCHTSKDECVNDADCRGSAGNFCLFSTERGIWACGSIAICAG